MAKNKINEILKIETVFILDEETKYFAKGLDKKNCKIILSLAELHQILANSFQVKNFIILVELDWGNSISQFYGYQVAKELMSSPRRLSNFNLLFISTLSRDIIYQVFKDKNRIFVQKFVHEHIARSFDLAKIVVPAISEKKYNYLAGYCLVESRIIDRLEHDIKNLLSNQDEEKLQKAIDEITANKDILTSEIISNTEKLKNTADTDEKNKLLAYIHSDLQILQNQINNPGENAGKKSHIKVMLIEDDTAILSKLKQQFSQYFHNINSFSNGSEAYAELKGNAMQYDAVITDMELLNGNFDDEKQGIDILELCEKEYPFIATRVITALPKNALKQLIGKRLNEIIFKSGTGGSIIPPFENLVEFVKQLDKEVQKRRQLRNMQGPTGSWWGTYLTKQLYITKIENPGKYDTIWQTAKNQASRFINGDFDSLNDTEKISVEFKGKPSNTPEAGWEIIELLLTHRLIAIWFANYHSWDEFYYSGDSNEAYSNLKGFQSGFNRAFKAYFNTFLGLSAIEISNTGNNGIVKCKITPINLFPEEFQWLSQIKSTDLSSFSLHDINDDFRADFEGFINFYNGTTIDEKTTFGEAMALLDDFITNYPNQKMDNTKHIGLKKRFTDILENSYASLLPEATKRIDTIKTDIFPY